MKAPITGDQISACLIGRSSKKFSSHASTRIMITPTMPIKIPSTANSHNSVMLVSRNAGVENSGAHPAK